MSDKLDFYFLQLVGESDMDLIQTNSQTSDHQMMSDQGYAGITTGYAVTPAAIPDLTVNVAVGVAYDQAGQRVELIAAVNLDVSEDSASVSTDVGSPGNEKWVSVYTQFDRVLTDPRFDGNGLPIDFQQAEGQQFLVLQGAEATAGTATKPALQGDALVIADILLEFGTTSFVAGASASSVPRIESADLVAKPLSRFEFIFNLQATTPAEVRDGQIIVAMQKMLTELNNHINNVANPHVDTSITSVARTDAATTTTILSAGSVGSQLQEIVDEFAIVAQRKEDTPIIDQTNYPGDSGLTDASALDHRLLYRMARGSEVLGDLRTYAHATDGWHFTQNAEWDPSGNEWVPDITSNTASRMGGFFGDADNALMGMVAVNVVDTAFPFSETEFTRAAGLMVDADEAGIQLRMNSLTGTFDQEGTGATEKYTLRAGGVGTDDTGTIVIGDCLSFMGDFKSVPTSFTVTDGAFTNVVGGTPTFRDAKVTGVIAHMDITSSGNAFWSATITVEP